MAVNDQLYDEGGAVINVQSDAVTILGSGRAGGGSLDDHSVLAGAEALSGALADVDLFFPKGTYLVCSNLPLGRRLIFARGAVLKPASGVTITITGDVSAGAYQIFDLSLGGTVAFGSNTAVREYLTPWWGIGTFADDGPAFNALLRSIPPNGAIVVHPPTLELKLATTVVLRRLHSVHITSRSDGRGSGSPSAVWSGAPDARVFFMDRCAFCTVEGFYIRGSSYGTGVDMDGEYLPAPLSWTTGATVGIVSGSRTVTDSAGGFSAYDKGNTIAIPGAAPGGGTLYSRVTAVVSASQLTIDAGCPAAAATVAGVTATFSTFGTRTFGATCSITAGTRTLTDGRNGFTDSDESRCIVIPGAGVAGQSLITYIKSVDSGGSATLDPGGPAAGTTVMNVAAQLDGEGMGTACTVRRCHILNQATNRNFVGVSISQYARTNWEYCVVEDVTVDGYSQNLENYGLAGTIAAGSQSLTVAGASFTSTDVGKRVRIANAGPLNPDNSNGTGFYEIRVAHDSVITGVSGSTATLRDAAANSVSGVLVVVGERVGTGVRNGFSYNAKGQLISNCQFNGLKAGIHTISGSYFSRKNSFSIDEICHWVEGTAEPSSDQDGNTEQCPTYFFGHAGGFSMSGTRHNVAPTQLPNMAAIHVTGGSPIALRGVAFQSMPYMLDAAKSGCYIYHQSVVYGQIVGEDVGYDSNLYIRETPEPAFTITRDISIEPGFGGLIMNRPLFVSRQDNAALTARFEPRNFNSADRIALKGETHGTGFNGYGIAIVGESAANGRMDGGPGGSYVAIQARQPTLTVEGISSSVVGFDVTTPNLAVNGSGASPVTGLRIQSQSGTGVASPLAIDQQGANDVNLLQGATTVNGRLTRGAGTVEKETAVSVAAAGTVTPDAMTTRILRVAAGGSFTLDAPANAVNGAVLSLEIFNASSGAVTVTTNAAYSGTLAAPSAGKWTTITYRYDGILAKWKPLGAQSLDFA